MIKNYQLQISLIALFLCSSVVSGIGQDSLQNSQNASVFQNPYAFKDTVYVKKYSYTDIFYSETFNDTTYQIEDKWYDPTQSENFLYADLGHIGSAAMQDYYNPSNSIGIRYDFPAYDLYKYKPDRTPEYKNNIAFTNLKFSQALSQSQQFIQADFAGNYRNGKLSIGYKRIKDNGYYLSQLNVHTAVYGKLSLKFDPVLLQFQFTSNVIQAQDNGGFTTDTLFPEPFTTFSSDVPINLSDQTAQTRHQEKYYTIRDYWPIVGKMSDTSFLAIRHQSQYSNQYVRFYDTSPSESYYPSKIYDDRGIRYFIKNNSIDNSLHLLWRTEQLSWLQGQLNAGLIHRWHFIEQGTDQRREQWLALDAQLQTDIGNVVRLDSRFTQSFIPDLNDTRFENELSFGWQKYFTIKGTLDFIRNRAGINENTFAINTLNLWDDALNPETKLNIGGALNITPIDSEIGVQYNIIDNLIYYNSALERIQSESTQNILRTYLSTRLNLGVFKVDSETSLMLTQNDILPYPRLVSDLRAYFNFYLFDNKMEISTGPYGKYYSAPHSYTYHPALGQFILDGEAPATTSYILNYMLSFRVRSFSVLAHITGLQSLWSENAFYEVHDYAHPIIGFRFGVTWKLYN